jgi:hypothetical protein
VSSQCALGTRANGRRCRLFASVPGKEANLEIQATTLGAPLRDSAWPEGRSRKMITCLASNPLLSHALRADAPRSFQLVVAWKHSDEACLSWRCLRGHGGGAGVLLRCPVASATCPQELICDCPSKFARECPREGRQQVSGVSGICGFVTVMCEGDTVLSKAR